MTTDHVKCPGPLLLNPRLFIQIPNSQTKGWSSNETIWHLTMRQIIYIFPCHRIRHCFPYWLLPRDTSNAQPLSKCPNWPVVKRCGWTRRTRIGEMTFKVQWYLSLLWARGQEDGPFIFINWPVADISHGPVLDMPLEELTATWQNDWYIQCKMTPNMQMPRWN